MHANPEQRITELRIVLPPVAKPRWTYAPLRPHWNLLFTSGDSDGNGRVLLPASSAAKVDVQHGAESCSRLRYLGARRRATAVGLARILSRAWSN